MKKWLKTMAWAAAAGAVLATVAVSAAGYAVQRATDGRVYACLLYTSPSPRDTR